jgi:tRNA(Ser,Leu) C12 N-acetylase TAN1
MKDFTVGGEFVPEEWNVLVVSHEGEERRLLRDLRDLGEFKFTGFRSLLLGRVDLRAFLEGVRARSIPSLARVVPVEENFRAQPENLLEVLKDKVKKYAGRIGRGESFCVRFERRGFKGLVSSREVEGEIGGYLRELLEGEGKSPKVSLEDPDKLLVIQSIGTSFGIGLIDRETRQKHPIIRVK